MCRNHKITRITLGTLTLAGGLTLDAGARLAIQVAGAAADRVEVTGGSLSVTALVTVDVEVLEAPTAGRRAILDWSALFLTTTRGLDETKGGLGYAAFAIAMTLGRFTGDKVVSRFGGKRVLTFGGLCAASGFFLAVLAPQAGLAMLGFVLIGLGAANIVPILFTAAGNQNAMPASLAVAAITTIGYAGILAGPAVIGFVAHATSLNIAFAMLGCALLLVAASARLAAPAKQAS